MSTEVGKLSNLGILHIADSGFLNGHIPSQIGLLKNVTVLHIKNTNIGGPIPKAIYSLNNLRVLQLSGSRISGTISTKFGLLSKLEVLELADTEMTGTVPSEIGLLGQLRILHLNGNRGLSASIPAEVCSHFRDGPNQDGMNAWIGESLDLVADCTPSISTGVPSMVCPEHCCNACCDVETQICTDRITYE